jgi:hypothetical protein
MNGFSLPNQINEFTVYPLKKSIQIGTNTNDPAQYGFSYYGLKQNEKILSGDIRKVGVIIKQAYTANKQLPNVDGHIEFMLERVKLRLLFRIGLR